MYAINLRRYCFLTFFFSLFLLSFAHAKAEIRTETFKVYGNCEMCKSNIEGALLKKDGIVKKSWNTETKMLTIKYDPSKITLTQIKQKIAAVGYDTDEVKGNDEAYNKLHACCKYRSKDNQ